MDALRLVLESKPKTLHKTTPQTTVLEAVDAMCRAHVGALLVCENDAPRGILSERDLLTRVILERRDPATTLVSDVMTRDLVCVDPDVATEEAMAIMTERRCRHLPVVVDRRVVGIVSLGDLARWTSRDREYQIRMLDEYVSGRYPG